MSNIVVSGYYGSKNAGDEAMLAAMIEVLSDMEPKINITVISANPADTVKRHGVKAVSWMSIGEIVSAIRKADLLISGGGSLLQNVTSGRSLYYYLGIIWLAQFFGTPVMLYAQGIGPIYGRFARSLMKYLSNRAAYITVRDKGSREEICSLDIAHPPIEVTADPVLAIHQVDRAIGRAILKKYNAEGAKLVVGISVREWREWEYYKDVLAAAADKIVTEFDARVVFMPMQYPEDVKAAEIITKKCKKHVTVLEGEYTTSELLSIVGNFDILISIRLHALIFAGVMGVPMIGISYDPKIDRFMDSIGEKSVGTLQDITTSGIISEVRRKLKNREAFQKNNEELMAGLRISAAHNAEIALGLIKKSKK